MCCLSVDERTSLFYSCQCQATFVGFQKAVSILAANSQPLTLLAAGAKAAAPATRVAMMAVFMLILDSCSGRFDSGLCSWSSQSRRSS